MYQEQGARSKDWLDLRMRIERIVLRYADGLRCRTVPGQLRLFAGSRALATAQITRLTSDGGIPTTLNS